MTSEIIYTFHNSLQLVQELVYDPCGFVLNDLVLSHESKEYEACSFKLNGRSIIHRIAKITPTKTGQFVTIWKRNKDGITAPFDVSDDIDFIIITTASGDNLGQFVFPKSVLADKEIITQNNKEGKRGIRVYPPWDVVNNKQAEKTQAWQVPYFLTFKRDGSTDLSFIKNILGD